MASTFLNLSTDTTLGGNSPSDSVAVSQKAIKTYVDNNSSGSYTAGTGIDIINDVISVTSPTLTNTATGSTNLTIYSQYSAQLSNCVNVGENSKASAAGTTSLGSLAQSFGMASTALGYGAEVYGYCAVAIGSGAKISSSITNDNTAIQIGRGTNSDPDTMYVGFGNYFGNHHNYKLLDGATGLIPSARIAIDGTSITINSSGQLQASGGGASVEAFTAAEVQTIWESV